MLTFASSFGQGYTSLVHGSTSFSVNSTVFPLNSLILNVHRDSLYCELDFVSCSVTIPPYYYTQVYIDMKDIRKYILDGDTVKRIGQIDTFYTTYMVSSGGSSGDATSIQSIPVSSATPLSGQYLKYDGSRWKPNNIAATDLIIGFTGSKTVLFNDPGFGLNGVAYTGSSQQALNGNLGWSNVPIIVAQVDTLALSGTATLISYAVSGTHTYEVSGYINTLGANPTTFTCNFVDENSVTEPLVLFKLSTPSLAPNFGTGWAQTATINIRCSDGGTIRIQQTSSGAGISYDCGFVIKQLR